MTMGFPGPELPTMRKDISALIVDWGVVCTVKRRGTTRNLAGAVSAPLSVMSTVTLWIQPFTAKSRRGSQMMDFGILDNTTHQAFERFSGYAPQNQDQIAAAGETYAYDVLSSQLLSTHRVIYLQQVKRA
jgi:hypothetical protein